MNPKKVQALQDAFPEIFGGEFAVYPACGDGWYDILYQALTLAQSRYEQVDIPPVRLTDIKEKFGTLNLYYMGGDDYTDGVFDLAQLLSGHTCEMCGKPGTLSTDRGWMVTRCTECKQ
jgi:hypothetical protein